MNDFEKCSRCGKPTNSYPLIYVIYNQRCFDSKRNYFWQAIDLISQGPYTITMINDKLTKIELDTVVVINNGNCEIAALVVDGKEVYRNNEALIRHKELLREEKEESNSEADSV